MAVKINDKLVHEPDALLRLGPPLDDEAILVPDPVIVIEVLSPSTGPVDTNTKLPNYFSVPSVQHYLVINAKKRIVQHYWRGSDGQPAMRLVAAGTLELKPPGIAIHLDALFAS